MAIPTVTPLTKEQMDEIETSKGVECGFVTDKRDRWQVGYRAPKRMEWKRFQSSKDQPEALEQLCRTLCVYPADSKSFMDLLERFPGIPVASAECIGELASVNSKDDISK